MLFLVEMFSWILPILAVLVLLIVIATGYVKAPPDLYSQNRWNCCNR